MKRLRELKFEEIKHGKLDKNIISRVEKMYNVEVKPPVHGFAIDDDDDFENRTTRRLVYAEKHRQVINLAKSTSATKNLFHFYPHNIKVKMDSIVMSWDMSDNDHREYLPDEVFNALKISLIAHEKKISALPHFISFERVEMEVQLTITKF